jgi:capsular exopolysaccharide synthesis family protein
MNEGITKTQFEGSPSVPQQGQEVNLIPSSLFEVFWRNRWIMLACVVAAVGGGFVYIMRATPIYSSTSKLYVEQTGPRIMEEVQGIMTQSKNYLFTQAELMKSSPIVSQALADPQINRLRTFEDVTNKHTFLKRALQVEVGKKDDLISVSLESPYPAEAAQVVNTIVDSYISYHSTQKKTTAGEVLKILQRQKEIAAEELETKRTQMLNFQKENPELTFETSQGNIILERLASLSRALTEAELQTVEARSRLESIKILVSDPTKLKEFIETQRAQRVYIYGGSETARLQAQLEALQMEISDRKALTGEHPAMTALEEKYQNIQAKLKEMDDIFVQSQLAVAEQEYARAQENENQIRRYFEKQRKDALSLNEKVTEYTVLRTDVQRTENLLGILDDRIKEVNVTEDTGALNISILEVARPEDKPVKPQKARILAMALVLGLILGGGLSLVRDWMDQKLRSADEISAILGVPILGTVPRMMRLKGISDRGMVVHNKSSSATAEAYRTIRTAVFFGVPDGNARTMLITSPAPGDGKTTLVSNIAIAMGQADQKTLIIDADFRKSMQHNIFGLPAQPGLSSLLAGQASLEQCIRKTPAPNLDLLPAGPEVVNPSEMLNSKAFSGLLKSLKDRYDRIIIDSPPVMAVTDARILSALCDITILVLRAEKSTRKVSQQARDGLLSVGSRLLGVVVNDISKRNGRYGYYSGSGYYGYGGYGSYGGYYGRKKEEKQTNAKIETIVG